MFSTSCNVSARYCGVCVGDLVADTVLGSTQNVGEVWKLPLSETNRFCAMSWAVKPKLFCFRAFDSEAQIGLVEGLLDPQISRS